MKKVRLSQDLKEMVSNIINSNDSSRTKVARALRSAYSDGISPEHSNDRKDGGNLFNYSNKSSREVSWIKNHSVINFLKENLPSSHAIIHVLNKKELSSEDLNKVMNNIPNEYIETLFNMVKLRTKGKPSKLVSKVFNKDYIKSNFSERDIEYFVNQYSSYTKNVNIEVVSGEDIKKWYLENNYQKEPSGTLNGSCMRQESKNEFMNIFSDNSNVKMLIALNESNKLLGRALIWENAEIINLSNGNEKYENVTYMDRVYYTHDWLVDRFKSYAKGNGMYIRNEVGAGGENIVCKPNGEHFNAKIKVSIGNYRYEKYPYMDTLHYIDFENGCLQNFWVERENESVSLRNQSSGLPNRSYDFIKGEYVRVNESVWLKDLKTYAHNSNIIEINDEGGRSFYHKNKCSKDRLGGYYVETEEMIECYKTKDKFAKRYMVEATHFKGFVHKKEKVRVDGIKGYVHKDDVVKSDYLGKRILKSESFHLKGVDDYMPKDILKSGVTEAELEKVIKALNTIKPKSKGDGIGEIVEGSDYCVFEL